MIFHWFAFIPMGVLVGLEQLPVDPQPTMANLIWIAVTFLWLEDYLK